MSTLAIPDSVWLMIVGVIMWFILGTLRTMGMSYSRSVAWHALRIQVEAIRAQQERRLQRRQEDMKAGNIRPSRSGPGSSPEADDGIETIEGVEMSQLVAEEPALAA